MTTVNIYLIFNGNCAEAFTFYKSVFGGEFITFSKYKDMPQTDDNKISPEQGEKLMHVSLPISKETYLMGSDGGNDWDKKHHPGNNFSVSISTDSRSEADRMFKALSSGRIGNHADGSHILEFIFWHANR